MEGVRPAIEAGLMPPAEAVTLYMGAVLYFSVFEAGIFA